MKVLKVTSENVSVFIEDNHNYYERVKDLLHPFFICKILSKRFSSNNWQIIGTKKLSNEQQHQNGIRAQLYPKSEPTVCYTILPNKKKIYITKPLDGVWRIQLLCRLVRDILRMELSRRGAVFFHSGMAVCDNKGICVMGGRKAGKTSTVLGLLKYVKGDFIANDYLYTNLIDGRPVCYGWPRTNAIREDTFRVLGLTSKQKYKLAHPCNATSLSGEYIFVYPKELVRYFDAQIRVKIKPHVFLFPQFYDRDYFGPPVLKILTRDELENFLLNNIQPRVDKHSPYFDKISPPYNLDYIKTVIKIISATTLGYRLFQSHNMLDQSARLIENLISNPS